MLSSTPSFLQAFGLVTILGILLFARHVREKRRTNPFKLPYPPGPSPRPIIGNLLDLPTENEAQTYYAMAKQYGSLVYMSVLGNNILVVNDLKSAHDLFEKRSKNYSDRPFSPMGWAWSFGHMPYGEAWKIHRKMFTRHFQSSVVHRYWPTQTKETHKLLRKLLVSPDQLTDHLRQNAAGAIIGVTYGLQIAEKNDTYIRVAETALEGMSIASAPGAFFVDLIPAMKQIPEWLLPKGGFKAKARYWRAAVMKMRDMPFDLARKEIAQGSASSSLVSNALAELDGHVNPEKEIEVIKNTAGMAYAAGAESTVSTLSTFVLAMVLYPEIREKAQKELDRVVGVGRIPEMADRNDLPYINAIMKEVLRWAPVAPLGLPHRVAENDEYKGYFIPKDTIIVGNATLLHDPVVYPEPEIFKPERWFEENLGMKETSSSSFDPLSVAFGFGRRTCPGRALAESHLFISMASILSVFDIGPGDDDNGKIIQAVPAFSTDGHHPKPFKFTMVPRSEVARQLIEQTADV
ncbi:cytochrome P450 [Flagelloscypha sp. PMI_526]|nr:cytochrome P450 [Flagelloscypha sp. PMI_526]